MTTVGTERRTTFGHALRGRPDAALEDLLAARPDLALPPPTSFGALAAAASARASLERALTGLDALRLAICECVVALDPIASEALGVPDVEAALGLEGDDSVRRAVDDLTAAALLWDAGDAGTVRLRPSPGLADLFGPYPAGLGPVLGDESHRMPAAADEETPPGAARIMAALTWGPPVGVVPASAPGRSAVRWLAERGLVARSDDRHVVLSREAGLALRSGRTHRDVPSAPPPVPGRALGVALVDGEAALAALEAVRLVAALVTEWAEEGPSPLRAGGLAVRDLRRVANRLGVDDASAVLVVETALAAGLIADDREAVAAFRPTAEARAWLAADAVTRWVRLSVAWRSSSRTPWLVGSRDARGAVRAALDPELGRGWVPRLRSHVLRVLADGPPGQSMDRGGVLEVLRWRTPRSVPPQQAVDGLLDGAAFLGVTAAEALSSAGRALVVDWPDRPVEAGAAPGAPAVDAPGVAAALAAMLPSEVDDLVLQGDLTGIVPGRPGPELSALVESAAVVESRGSAMTLRFTPESVARALEHTTADELMAGLDRFSRVGVPQPLEYLVRDTARRQGNLRIGAASAYLRSDDAALLAGLAARADLRSLGLAVLAPTVLVSSAPAAEVHAALRAAGVSARVEGPGGTVVSLTGARPRGEAARRTSAVAATGEAGVRPGAGHDGAESAAAAAVRRRRVIAVLRAAEAAGRTAEANRRWAGGPAAPGAEAPPGTAGDGAGAAEKGSGSASDTDVAGSARTGAAAGAGPGDAAMADSAEPTDDATGVPPDDADETATDPPEALGLLREAIADQGFVWIEMVGPDGTVMRRRLRPLKLDAGRLRALDPEREAEVTVAVHRVASVRREE